MALALSSTEPPPTLRMASTPCSRDRAMASRTFEMSGLLTMPPHATNEIPCSFRLALTLAKRPSPLMRSLP
ncbi:hypothetical protein D3C73_1592160 [compost metagenome]